VKYSYQRGVEKQKGSSKKWLAIPVIGVIVGGYVLLNTVSPMIELPTANNQVVAQKLTKEQPTLNENRLYIPQINVDIAVVPIEGDETLALEKGAIHRAPDSGNPKDGGNFVVAAHRFQLGLTPDQTRKKSPFYHIDKMKTGDQFYVDYDGIRYAYEVTEKKQVSPTAVEIESKTEDNRLTLYSCELAGPKAGRDVIIAKLTGTVAWDGGAPKLKSLN
jgi:LPXTG-site transpeptidase (sortase) family protein